MEAILLVPARNATTGVMQHSDEATAVKRPASGAEFSSFMFRLFSVSNRFRSNVRKPRTNDGQMFGFQGVINGLSLFVVVQAAL